MDHIITCGITPTPSHPKVLKTALTSCNSIPSTHVENVVTVIEDLKALGYMVISMETTSKSVPYTALDYSKYKPPVPMS